MIALVLLLESLESGSAEVRAANWIADKMEELVNMMIKFRRNIVQQWSASKNLRLEVELREFCKPLVMTYRLDRQQWSAVTLQGSL